MITRTYQHLFVAVFSLMLSGQVSAQEVLVNDLLDEVPPLCSAYDPFSPGLTMTSARGYDWYVGRLKRLSLTVDTHDYDAEIEKNLAEISDLVINHSDLLDKVVKGFSAEHHSYNESQRKRKLETYFKNDCRTVWEFYLLSPVDQKTSLIHDTGLHVMALKEIASIDSAPVFHQKLWANSRYLEKQKDLVRGFEILDFQNILDYFTIHTCEQDLAEIFIWAHDFDTKFPQLEDANAGLGMGSQLVYEMLITEVKGNFPWQATIEKYRSKAIPDKQTKVLSKADDFIKSAS